MNSSLKKSGFTLTELLVVLGIFTFIIGVSFTLLISGNLSVDVSEAQIQAAENARRAIDKISKELRLSRIASTSHIDLYDSLTIPDSDGDLDTGSVIYFQIPLGSYGDNLTLAANYSLLWGDGTTENNYVFYCLDPEDTGFLFRGTCTSADKGTSNIVLSTQETGYGVVYLFPIAASHISSLNFSRDSTSAELINIEVEGQGEATSGTVTQVLHTGVKVRN